jgi:translation initiation factor IF-3
MADSEGMDLIEISPNAAPPVVKMMDYGKYKYQIQKKLAEAKNRYRS